MVRRGTAGGSWNIWLIRHFFYIPPTIFSTNLNVFNYTLTWIQHTAAQLTLLILAVLGIKQHILVHLIFWFILNMTITVKCWIIHPSSSHHHLIFSIPCLWYFFFQPLLWQQPYVPVLARGMLDFLMAPTAFLMGCHVSHFEEVAAVSTHNTPNQLILWITFFIKGFREREKLK